MVRLVLAVALVMGMLGTVGTAGPVGSRDAGPARGAEPSHDARPAGFVTPEHAGFRHAALVYDEARTGTDALARQVAHRRDGRPVRDGWLFDAFVHLTFTARSGERTDYGRTDSRDWAALLRGWLGPHGAVRDLDAAIARTAAETATDGRVMGPPPRPREIVIAMPWPSPRQRAFGTVDGRPADLGSPAERARVAGWYARQVAAMFTAMVADAGLRHVRLWGVYLMREDAVGADGEWMEATAREIHAAGLRVLWIPYWGANGTTRARARGVDVVIVQPSYAFTSPADGGRVGAARLRSAAALASAHGLGVEVEVRGGAATPDDRKLLRQYLSAGAALGHQGAATAWFLGWRPTPFDPLPDGTENPAYHDIAAHVLGRPVADEDVHAPLTVDGAGATIRFPTTDALRALRIDLADETTAPITAAAGAAGGAAGGGADGPADGVGAAAGGRVRVPWAGRIRVDAHTARGWEFAGWAARRLPEPGDERHPSVMVPLRALTGVDGLRATFDGPAAPQLTAMIGDTSWRPAEPRPPNPWSLVLPARYPDRPTFTEIGLDAGKLTDGTWSDRDWHSGHQVGWRLQSGEVRVVIDLGAVHPVDRIVVRTHASTAAGVTWPVAPVALLSAACPVVVAAGTDPPPCEATVAPGPNATPAERPDDASYGGLLTMTPPPGTTARWVTVVASGHGWLMLDEIEVLSAGTDVAAHARYHISPPPTRTTDPAGTALTGPHPTG